MKCRGKETRKQIVKEYNITPILHTILLNGQRKYSDAEAIIENEYYVFEAIRKSDRKKEVIQCGMGAARDFLSLINHSGLTLFNPLKIKNKDIKKDIETNKKTETEWHPIAKQLYNAIMWIFLLWDIKPGTPVFTFRDDIIKYKGCKPLYWKIKRVNTTIQRLGKGKKLTEYIEVLKSENDFKEEIYNFSLLNNEIEKMKDNLGNKINSFF